MWPSAAAWAKQPKVPRAKRVEWLRRVAACDRLRQAYLAENAMGRDKHLIGPKLRARKEAGQKGEAGLAVQVLNRMIREPKLISIRRR